MSISWLLVTGSAFGTVNFDRIENQMQEILNFFNVKIAHILLGLGIIRHWTRHLVCLGCI